MNGDSTHLERHPFWQHAQRTGQMTPRIPDAQTVRHREHPKQRAPRTSDTKDTQNRHPTRRTPRAAYAHEIRHQGHRKKTDTQDSRHQGHHKKADTQDIHQIHPDQLTPTRSNTKDTPKKQIGHPTPRTTRTADTQDIWHQKHLRTADTRDILHQKHLRTADTRDIRHPEHPGHKLPRAPDWHTGHPTSRTPDTQDIQYLARTPDTQDTRH